MKPYTIERCDQPTDQGKTLDAWRVVGPGLGDVLAFGQAGERQMMTLANAMNIAHAQGVKMARKKKRK